MPYVMIEEVIMGAGGDGGIEFVLLGEEGKNGRQEMFVIGVDYLSFGYKPDYDIQAIFNETVSVDIHWHLLAPFNKGDEQYNFSKKFCLDSFPCDMHSDGFHDILEELLNN